MSDINATDAAVKLAEEQGLDLADVLGTGVEGRVTKGDVEAHLAALEGQPVETVADAEPEAPVITLTAPGPGQSVTISNLTPPTADPVLAIIAALPNLGSVINWAGDRESYADELRARAQELLNA